MERMCSTKLLLCGGLRSSDKFSEKRDVKLISGSGLSLAKEKKSTTIN